MNEYMKKESSVLDEKEVFFVSLYLLNIYEIPLLLTAFLIKFTRKFQEILEENSIFLVNFTFFLIIKMLFFRRFSSFCDNLEAKIFENSRKSTRN